MANEQEEDKNTEQKPLVCEEIDADELEENEPYLGPAWAVVMLILYFLKEAFPAEPYSPLWWFQIYVIGIVISITIFTLIKRHQFYKIEKKRLAEKRKAQK